MKIDMSKISHYIIFFSLTYVHVRHVMFVYKHSETIEYVKN